MNSPVKPMIFALVAFSLEAGPLINTRENPLYRGDDLTVDYTMTLSAVSTKVDVDATFNSILIEDTEASLVSQAATAAPGSRGPGVGVQETSEEDLGKVEEQGSGSTKRTASLIVGAMGLGLAGVIVWRARTHNNKVGLWLDDFAASVHRLWYAPSLLGSREVWGGHTPFWTRVDRFLDRVEAGRDLFRFKKKKA